MTKAKQIGIVGFGLMGRALAERLIGAGYGVVGFDIDPEKLRSLEKLGGTAAASPADVARQCDVLFLAVFNTEQVEEVVERDLLPALGAGSGKILLCASTCDPDRIAALAERIAPQGRAPPRHADLRNQRAGAAGPGRCPGRRGGRQACRGRRCARRGVSVLFPHGAGRQCRPHQARHQSDPRSQPSGVGGGASVRRAHGARAWAVSRGGAAGRLLLAGDGYQGAEDGARRFRAGRTRTPDAQGRRADAGAGAASWVRTCRSPS